MIDQLKEFLNELSKDQLIYLIEQFFNSRIRIGKICVSESKQHISSEDAVEKIRENLYSMPGAFDVETFKAQIDFQMNKISVEEYRKILGFED